MILRILGHTFHYEMENLCRIFYPNEKINLVYDLSGDDSKTVVTSVKSGVITVSCSIDGATESGSEISDGKNDEMIMGRLVFFALSKISGTTPPWGILTGVRPAKLMTKYAQQYGKDEAIRIFKDDFLVSNLKTELAMTVAEAQEPIINLSKPESFSLYISIPFCPSRCSYCSFVSNSITSPQAKKLIPDYIDKLCEEISQLGDEAAKLDLKLESIYFGGGTPSVLGASQLDRICTQIESSFDLSYLREYTVECGRPDTITVSKLRTLKYHKVGRISINPQTFSQEILDTVGRKHTVEQSVSAYRLAKSQGFNTINMDLIAGLTGDTVENFCESVDTAISLSPENITIHSLALKRSSELAESGAQVASGSDAARMLEYAGCRLTEAGYSPYYMYRQSKCVGNLENVGWSKPGHECLYNVFMMEECHTVLAAGAGAVTRLKSPYSDYIERIFNFKYPYEYISRFDELTDRKPVIAEFYGKQL